MRKFDWIALLLVVIVAIGGKFQSDSGSVPENHSQRRPDSGLFEPQHWDAETVAWLEEGAQEKRSETAFVLTIPKEGTIKNDTRKGSSTGSAVSISSDGYWLTARHVVEGCDQTYLRSGERRVIRIARIVVHPRADVARLFTDGAPEGVPVAASLEAIGDTFSIGFPKGAPGAVHGRFLGEMTMRHTGSGRYRERVYAWSILSEIPRRFASLGGLSGGAVIDGAGRIVGVVQSEAPRRGRFMTARPKTYRELFELAEIDVPMVSGPASEVAVSAANYGAVARALITTLRVAKVLCIVK
jgi:S1-C subfamily serine protease